MAEAVILKKILEELMENAKQIRQEELEKFSDQIQMAKRVFVAGAGRSGFVARAFSNRLMHLGLTVYFVGEPTTPSIQEGDLLIIASGSGETGSLKVMAAKAKEQG
ncbi:MAG TPA: 6-phospho-3-hexuloisomerase, partial [Lachnospiraceae bacterium]|nr:6-phospho-3-hexuloisomerase [Lachnospiraceae bacterium]